MIKMEYSQFEKNCENSVIRLFTIWFMIWCSGLIGSILLFQN